MKVLQKAIEANEDDIVGKTLKMADLGGNMRYEFNQIYHLILEKGMSAYGAAKTISESRLTDLTIQTLHYHAQTIEVILMDTILGITPESIVKELIIEGEVDCPEELASSVRKSLREEKIDVTEWIVFRTAL